MLKLVALILPLGLDTFAVSTALGLNRPSARHGLRISLLLTAFEASMPLVGLALGAPIGRAARDAAQYIAIALLISLGLFTLFASEAAEQQRLTRLSTSGPVAMLILGLSVSLDEIAIGFTFGLLRVPAIPALTLIAVQAFIAAQLGLRLGARMGERIREGAEKLAGVALTVLGLGLLVSRLVG